MTLNQVKNLFPKMQKKPVSQKHEIDLQSILYINDQAAFSVQQN